MACNKCKQKNKEPLTTLSNINLDDLTLAQNYISYLSQMDNDKWDFVIDVYRQLFPTAQVVNRGCSDCLRRVCKSITHEYNRLVVNQENK